MSKFWVVVTGLMIAAGALLATSNGHSVNVTDLETECRYDRGSEVNVDLTQQDSLTFSGHFPVDNPETELDYSYSVLGNKVKFDVATKETRDRPESFVDNCLASAIYDAETEPLDPGSYYVQVFHDGERVEEKVIQVR